MAKIAECFVDIFAKRKRYDQAILAVKRDTNSKIAAMQKKWDQYGKSIRKVGMAISGAGLAMSGAFTYTILAATRSGDALDKMSKRTGIAVETLSELKFAAEISGASIETVEKSMRFLARSMDDFSRGVGESKDKFQKFGLEVLDGSGKLRSTVDVMKDASDIIAGLTSETEQVAVATDLFGSRFGAQLLPLLKEGSAGIEKLTKRAGELGLVMSTEAAAKAAEFNDRMTELKSSLSFAAINIGNALLPVIENLVKKMTEVAGKVSKWIKENERLVKSIGKWGLAIAGIMVAGGPLLMLAPTIIKTIIAVKSLTLAMGGLSAVSWGPIALGLLAVAGGVLAIGVAYKKHKEELKDLGVRGLAAQWDAGKLSVEELIVALKHLGITTREQASKYGLGRLFPPGLEQQIKDVEGAIGGVSGKLAVLSAIDPNTMKYLIPTTREVDLIKRIADAYSRIDKLRPKADPSRKMFEPPRGMTGERLNIPEGVQLTGESVQEIKRIGDAWYELTHTYKELKDKEWRIEEDRLRKLEVGEATLLKAKELHYADYHRQRLALIKEESDIAMAAIVDQNKADEDAYQKILDRQEDMWKKGSDLKEKERRLQAGYTQFFERQQDLILGKFLDVLRQMDEAHEESLQNRKDAEKRNADSKNRTQATGDWGLGSAFSTPRIGKTGPVIQKPLGSEDDDETKLAPSRASAGLPRIFLRPNVNITGLPTITLPGERVSGTPVSPRGSSVPGGMNRSGGSVTVNQDITFSFPNIDLANMDPATFQRTFNYTIVPAIREAARNGLLNEVIT